MNDDFRQQLEVMNAHSFSVDPNDLVVEKYVTFPNGVEFRQKTEPDADDFGYVTLTYVEVEDEVEGDGVVTVSPEGYLYGNIEPADGSYFKIITLDGKQGTCWH